jgi:hypothetical protein
MNADADSAPRELDRLRELETACRRLRQAGLAGVLAASDHRNAALCEQAWREVAERIDRRSGERRD